MKALPVTVHDGQSYDLANSFRESGEELILFIHGLGCSRKAFDLAWDQQNLSNYSLLSLDLLGFGESPKPLDFPYTMEAHGDVVSQVIHQLQDYKIHFVGSSMGPVIGLTLSDETLNTFGSFANLEARLFAEDCGNSAKAAAISLESFLMDFWPALKEKVKDKSVTAYDLENALPEAFYYGGKSVVELAKSEWSYQRFMELQIPKKYFYGDDEKSQNMRILSSLKGKIPMQQISDSGHFMMLDNPSDFYGALARFIKDAK